MPNATTRPTLNIPIIALWVVSVAVAVFGFFFQQAGNAEQAKIYTSGGSDYAAFLAAQGQSTIGGLLVAVGVIGVFLALAIHAGVWAASNLVAANRAEVDEFDRDLDDDEDGDDGFETSDAEAPVVEADATEASAAPEEAVAEPEPTGAAPARATDRD